MRRQFGRDAGERQLEIAVDVVRQRLERRDVDHLRGIGQLAGDGLPHQPIDRREERRQGLARAGGRGDQCVAPSGNRRPRRHLRRGGLRELRGKPARNGGMEIARSAWMANSTLRAVDMGTTDGYT